MSLYKTKEFARFARKARLDDDNLAAGAAAVAAGRWDADLGGGLFKQRIARAGGGKSGGFRTIIVFKAGLNSFYIYGFAKSDKANVTSKELKALKALASTLLGFDTSTVSKAVAAGELIEVGNDDQDGE